MQAMKDWHKSHPHLFIKSPRNHAGRDTYTTPWDTITENSLISF